MKKLMANNGSYPNNDGKVIGEGSGDAPIGSGSGGAPIGSGSGE